VCVIKENGMSDVSVTLLSSQVRSECNDPSHKGSPVRCVRLMS
jgi:hypothetical protein